MESDPIDSWDVSNLCFHLSSSYVNHISTLNDIFHQSCCVHMLNIFLQRIPTPSSSSQSSPTSNDIEQAGPVSNRPGIHPNYTSPRASTDPMETRPEIFLGIQYLLEAGNVLGKHTLGAHRNFVMHGPPCMHKKASKCYFINTIDCCACSDRRPHTPYYLLYVDGVGETMTGVRWQHYCTPCQGTLSLTACFM